MENRAKGIRSSVRPLTNSEKFLLTALVIILLTWLAFRFVFDPQAVRMEELEAEKTLFEEEIAEHNRILRSEETIKKDFEDLAKEKEELVSNFFPVLDQPQIIYLLNDLLTEEKVNMTDMSFSRAYTETKGDLTIYRMDIDLPLSGQYEGVFNTVKALEKSPRRILVNNLDLGKEDDSLKGSMSLKIYSLEGLAEADKVVIPIDIFKDGNVKPPFTPYKDYKAPVTSPESPDPPSKGEEEPGGDETGVIIPPKEEETKTEEIMALYDFEDGNYGILALGEGVDGEVAPSSVAKSGNYSMMLEFDIGQSENPNGAFVDLSNNNIYLDKNASTIGLWVYAYESSPASLNLLLEGQDEESTKLRLSQEISWLGWSFIKADLPNDAELYPLKLKGIYLELAPDKASKGVLLMDSLEASYPIYEEYVVKRGDTIIGISLRKYGTTAYVNEILDLNKMKFNDILPVGKVLTLRKR